MRVELPLRTCVFVFRFCDRLIRIGAGMICREFAEKQYVFGTADAHLCAVLALLCPAESVRLIVFPNDVG